MLAKVRRHRTLFAHRATGCQVAAQNCDSALRLERLVQRKNDALRSTPASSARGTGAERRHACQILAYCPTADRQLIQVQKTAVRKLLHYRRNTAGVVQLLHVKGPARTQIR